MSNKNALNEAVLDFQKIVDEITSRSTVMLSEQMRKDINKKINEDIEDEDESSDDEVIDIDTDEVSDVDVEVDADTENIEDTEDLGDDSEDVEVDAEIDSEEVSDELEVDAEIDGEIDSEEVLIDDVISDELSDIVDGTELSDEELVQVFKKVTDETEIEVVKNDDNSISLKKGDEEYLVKIDENEKLGFLDKILNDETDDVETGEDDVVIEIEVDDTDTLDEVSRTHSDGRKMVRKPEGFYQYAKSRLRYTDTVNENLLKESQELKNTNATLESEIKKLNEDIEKYKDATILMKKQLDEVALLNHKMVYVNRIFCEHATTRNEKETILERFDAITESKDVKSLYKTIVKELESSNINENVIKTQKAIGGTGKSLLEESEKINADSEIAKLNERLDRMKQLMRVGTKK